MASNEVEILDPGATVEKLTKVSSRRALNRRNFMAGLGVAGATAGAALVAGRKVARPTTVSANGPTQNDYLAFVLNIAYLQATFYSYITQGTDLPGAITAGGGAITGAPAAALVFANQQITDILNEMYYDELNHVIGLRNILGSAFVYRPAINLAGYQAITSSNALSIARMFEDVGATAYAGITGYLTGSNLTYAGQLLAVEAFHAGAIRLLSIQNPTIAAYLPTSFLYFDGVLASGSAVITSVSSTAGLVVGSTLTGVGIPATAKISAITVPSTGFGTGVVTMSIAATANTTANTSTVVATNTPSDAFDVAPADPGSAAAAGPSAIAGTTNPIIYQGFFDTAVPGNSSEVNPTGLAFARTTSQVLTALYGSYGEATGAAAAPAYPTLAAGGFFPSGFSGNIKTI
jgi:Ferritin-like domain